AVSQKVLGSSSPLANTGADVQQGEVAGPAAEVADEDQFIAVQRGFVMVGGRHRLQFEIHGFKSSLLKGLLQARESVQVISVSFGADELYRASHRGKADGCPELTLGVFAKIGKNAG